jgi:hypothetical protein
VSVENIAPKQTPKAESTIKTEPTINAEPILKAEPTVKAEAKTEPIIKNEAKNEAKVTEPEAESTGAGLDSSDPREVYNAEVDILFRRFAAELKGKHPTEAFDRTPFCPYSPEELALMNAPPKYSRPHSTFMGGQTSPSQVWSFPLTITLALVFNATMQEKYHPEWWALPYRHFFPPKEAEEAV